MGDINFTPESGDISFRPESGNFGGASTEQNPGNTGGDIADRASQAVESGKSGVAGGMSSIGDRLDSVADNLSQRGGVASRASDVVRGAGDALDSGANYVRSTSFSDMRDDLSTSIRNHPLLSMGVAIGAGYILSKILD